MPDKDFEDFRIRRSCLCRSFSLHFYNEGYYEGVRNVESRIARVLLTCFTYNDIYVIYSQTSIIRGIWAY